MAETLNEEAVLTPVVLGFGDQGVNRALLFPDFQALWQGGQTLLDCAGRRHRFVYLLLDDHRRVKAAVFFLLAFDAQGRPLPEWDLPLVELAERGGVGPDLGAGPIRLASRSLCPISWHQGDLWDPRSEAEHDDWQAIRDCLGLVAPRDGEVELAGEYHPSAADGIDVEARLERVRRILAQEHQEALDKLIAGQRTRLLTLTRQHQEDLARLQRDADELRAAKAELEVRYAALAQHLEQQHELARQQREELNEQMRTLERNALYKIEALRIQSEAESEARVAAAVGELKNQLTIREVELKYRDELDGQLQEDIRQLRERCAQLIGDSNEGQLERLARQGILFVTFQPGAGHLILSRQDVPRFSADPLGYVAEHCKVSREQYQRWLEHHQQPVCQAEVDGARCGRPVVRVEHPAQFDPLRSTLCAEHRGDDSDGDVANL